MINSDFFLPALSYTCPQLRGFGVFFVFSSLGKLRERKRRQGNPLRNKVPPPGMSIPGRGMKGSCCLTMRVCGCLIKPADTQCWAAQNPPGSAGWKQPWPSGLCFLPCALLDELKAGEAQAGIASPMVSQSSAPIFSFCRWGRVSGITWHRLWLLHPNLSSIPKVPCKQKSLLCLFYDREILNCLFLAVQLLCFTLVLPGDLKHTPQHLSLHRQGYMWRKVRHPDLIAIRAFPAASQTFPGCTCTYAHTNTSQKWLQRLRPPWNCLSATKIQTKKSRCFVQGLGWEKKRSGCWLTDYFRT